MLYYLVKPGTEGSFVAEELMLIPEDVEVPPYYVKECESRILRLQSYDILLAMGAFGALSWAYAEACF